MSLLGFQSAYIKCKSQHNVGIFSFQGIIVKLQIKQQETIYIQI